MKFEWDHGRAKTKVDKRHKNKKKRAVWKGKLRENLFEGKVRGSATNYLVTYDNKLRLLYFLAHVKPRGKTFE